MERGVHARTVRHAQYPPTDVVFLANANELAIGRCAHAVLAQRWRTRPAEGRSACRRISEEAPRSTSSAADRSRWRRRCRTRGAWREHRNRPVSTCAVTVQHGYHSAPFDGRLAPAIWWYAWPQPRPGRAISPLAYP